MEEKYSSILEIPCFMFDCNEELRPAAFMDIAQQLAAKGSEQLGIADQDLAKYGLVWILARMTVEFDTLPRRRDSAAVSTWHRGTSSLFFLRDYLMSPIINDSPSVNNTQSSKPLIKASSSWVLMDLKTRTVVRPDNLPNGIDTSVQNPEAVLTSLNGSPYNCGKIILPREASLKEIGSHKVVYSDLDYNGHANNAKYTVWALDSLPFDYVRNHPVRRIEINFNKEAPLGETVHFYHAELSPDTHLLEGRSGDSQIFITKLIFGPSSDCSPLSA